MEEKEIVSIFFAHIGEFVVEFEQICQAIESGIMVILEKEGLENEQIHEILLSGFTAEPLTDLFHSLCHEHMKPDGETAKIIDYVFKTFRELISVRNDLLHGKWFIILKELNGKHEPIALGQKLHRNKTGAATKRFEHDINDFKHFVRKAKLSRSNMSKLRNCIAGDYPILKNFMNIGKHKFEAITGLCVR